MLSMTFSALIEIIDRLIQTFGDTVTLAEMRAKIQQQSDMKELLKDLVR